MNTWFGGYATASSKERSAAARRVELVRLARRLRPVPDEVGHVLEHERRRGHRGPSASRRRPPTPSAARPRSRASRAPRRTRRVRIASSSLAGERRVARGVRDRDAAQRCGSPPPSARSSAARSRTRSGCPSRSNSFASAAPQRVPVPQVPVRITAPTSASRSSAAISCPNFAAVATGVSTPLVV